MGKYLKTHGDTMTAVGSQTAYLSGMRVDGDRFRWRVRRNEDGVDVVRVFALNAWRRSIAWRVLAFLWFAFASTLASLTTRKADVVIGTTPPPFQPLSGLVVARLWRRPFLLEVRDLWPAALIDMGVLRNPTLMWLAEALESFLYSQADHIVVNSPAYVNHVVGKGVDRSTVSLVPNGADTTMFDPEDDGSIARQRYQLGDAFIVMYAGAHGLANDLDVVLEAAERLRNHEGIRFVFVGDGPERIRLEDAARRKGLVSVTFLGALPKKDMPKLLSAANACVATLLDVPRYKTTYPNKVFDYMAAGRPTVLGIDGPIRDVIEASGGGVFVGQGDPGHMAETILDLSRNRAKCTEMGRAARRYVVSHFDRRHQAETMHRILRQLTDSRKPTTVG